MSLNFSSGNAPCANGSSMLSYPFRPSYSLTENTIFDDQLNPYYDHPVDLGYSSTKNSSTRSSISQHSLGSQQTSAHHAGSTCHLNHQRDGFDDESSPVSIKLERSMKPTVEEVTLQRRREQNRASQRAYRARRDKHTEELEQRNQFLQQHATSLLEENEVLKLQLAQLLHAQHGGGSTSVMTLTSPTVLSDISPTSSTIASSSPPIIQFGKEYPDRGETWGDTWI